MNDRIYTLIANKPANDDVCRGCLMASYEADYKIHFNITEQEVIDLYSKYETKEIDKHECGYDLFVLRLTENGMYPIIGIPDDVDMTFVNESDEIYEQSRGWEAEGQELQRRCLTKTEELKTAIEAKKEAERKAEAKREKDRERQAELRELNRLQKKFLKTVD